MGTPNSALAGHFWSKNCKHVVFFWTSSIRQAPSARATAARCCPTHVIVNVTVTQTNVAYHSERKEQMLASIQEEQMPILCSETASNCCLGMLVDKNTRLLHTRSFQTPVTITGRRDTCWVTAKICSSLANRLDHAATKRTSATYRLVESRSSPIHSRGCSASCPRNDKAGLAEEQEAAVATLPRSEKSVNFLPRHFRRALRNHGGVGEGLT